MWLGIRSHALGEIHEKIGIAFVVVVVLHVLRNAKAFTFMIGQTRSLIVIGVLGAVAALLIGGAMMQRGGGRGGHGGPPQYAVAERLSHAPIAQVAPALGMQTNQVIARLRNGGIVVAGPGQNLSEIAGKQNIEVNRLYRLILSDGTEED
jgi:hypothetical protein